MEGSRSQASAARSQPGTVALVGAGPGDPGLITLRGVECLAAADVVLYDYLANAQLLEHCRPDAVLVCLGKHGRDRILSQDEINARMTAEALAGRYVVRLKGGDPAVFARCSEEIAALEAAGLRYEVVPGITTALAAGSHAGIALTDRRHASAVALVTGHEQDDQSTSKLDYAALAKFPGTLVFYMGVTSAATWSKQLIDAGMPERNAGRGDSPLLLARSRNARDDPRRRRRDDEAFEAATAGAHHRRADRRRTLDALLVRRSSALRQTHRTHSA